MSKLETPGQHAKDTFVLQEKQAVTTSARSVDASEKPERRAWAPAVGDTWDLHLDSQAETAVRISLLSIPSPRHPTRPCRLEAVVPLSATALPSSLLESGGGRVRVALSDFIARRFQVTIAGSPMARSFGIRSGPIGPFCLETNWVRVSSGAGGCGCSITVVLDVTGAPASPWGFLQDASGVKGGSDGGVLAGVLGVVKKALLGCDQRGGGLNANQARSHVKCIMDQRHLRDLVTSSNGIAFIADGAILPRIGGAENVPMKVSQGAIPFQSPPSLRHEFTLPHRGIISGMLLPRGVTIIVGGGYHGKSTLLRALAVGVYDKAPGDGREFAVTDPNAVTVRAEDGRSVSGVDISPFISALPTSVARPAQESDEGAEKGSGRVGATVAVAEAKTPAATSGEGVERDCRSTKCFSTRGASGSTSQAANVMEALEAGATALLLDEDTCAGNFMIRDSRMRAMVSHEPITPFIYRVSNLWLELGVSSVIVVGGCGDYFDVHDTAILVDNYIAMDATERAHSISRRFCVGRVQFAGRGLVHRLQWPGNLSPRTVVPESVFATRKKSAKRRAWAACVNEYSRSVPKRGCGDVNATNMTNGTESAEDTVVAKQQQDTSVVVATVNVNGAGGAVGMGSAWPECVDEDSQVEEVDHEEEPVGGGISRLCSCTCYCGAAGSLAGDDGNTVRVGNASADVSRVEQIVGGAAQTRGCALGVEWVLRATQRSPGLTVGRALDALDAALRKGEGSGLAPLLELTNNLERRGAGGDDVSSYGPVAKPRRFEVAAALNRLAGVRFACAASVGVPAAVGSSVADGVDALEEKG